MKCKKFLATLMGVVMLFSLCAVGAQAAENEVNIVLSDNGITVDGKAVSTDSSDAVYVGAEIIYYKDGTDETYGEGEESEKHSSEEAAAHTVVTITRPGTYRVSGTLSAGQIAIDLGKDAQEDPSAVVTIILDNANVTCTVAPALIFYNVYECCEAGEETASAVVDTTAAGANIILAAGSVNNFTGSHVARIYKEGTTKKLHKYDAAFYSKLSMNINGDNGDDSGVLNIVSDNEGLDSELHLTINGGTINIESQDDGINTNEDYISVTTINGGNLTVNAGLGIEGDGIDSNGYLTINGGTIWTMANPRSPDGGIDADCAITINGGTLYAFGTRNDATDRSSKQPYMELSFASTLAEGTEIKVTDTEGNVVWEAVTRKACQSLTLTNAQLKLDTVYNVYVNDVLQCYSGNGFGMMGGGMMPPGGMGGQMPGGDMGGMTPPEGFDPSQMGGQMPEMPQGGQMPGGMMPPEMPEGGMPGGPGGMTPPEGFDPSQMGGQMPGGPGGMPGGNMSDETADGSGSVEFVLTADTKSFSGVCDSEQSGKTRVSFDIDGVERSGRNTVIKNITSITASAEIDPSLVQITVADDPSEDYSENCLLSDGMEAINALLPEDEGNYTLTVAVISGNETYTGATQVSFVVEGEPFMDVDEDDDCYEAVKKFYQAGIVSGVDNGTFLPDGQATRAQVIAILALIDGGEGKIVDAFSDVKENAWYAKSVGWAYENGIVRGDGQGYFNPEMLMSVSDMLILLKNYTDFAGIDYEVETTATGALTRGMMVQMLEGLL